MFRNNANRARVGSHPATYQEVMKWATSAVATEGLSSLTMLQGEAYNCNDGRIPKLPQSQVQAKAHNSGLNKATGRGGKKESKGNKMTYAGNNKAFVTCGSICIQYNGRNGGCTQKNCQRRHVCMAEDENGTICGGNHSIRDHED